jgi:tetratricopeptide (TPR) repeat protein
MSELPELYAKAVNLELEGKTQEAITLFNELAEVNPKDAVSRYRLAVLYFQTAQYELAERYARNSLKLNPKDVRVNILLAECFWATGQRDLCIRHLNFTLQLSPNALEVHQNISLHLSQMGNLLDAIKHLIFIRELEPNDLANLKELARTFLFSKQLDEAEKTYREILDKDPNNAEVHFNLGALLLSRHNTKEAWEHYAWRHALKPPQFLRFNKNYNQWMGQDLKGKTILISWEQGIGDTIHFVRYVYQLLQMGAKVILDVRPLLLDLFSGLQTVSNGKLFLHNTNLPQPPADYFLSVMDIPYVLRSLAIPDKEVTFPYLQTPLDLVAEFEEKVSDIQGLKVGIAWQGNPEYARDATRSIPLSAFNEVAQMNIVNLVSLQALFGTDQLKDFPYPIKDLEKDILEGDRGLSRLAAAIEAMDLIICCDSAIAHLAGALNKPVWMLIPSIPDWRWGWNSSSTPLYPAMKIFRTPKGSTWTDVVNSLIPSLKLFNQNKYLN